MKCHTCGVEKVLFFNTYQCLDCDKDEIRRIMGVYNSNNTPGFFPYDKNSVLHKGLNVGLHVPEKIQHYPFRPGIINDSVTASGGGGYNELAIRVQEKNSNEEDIIQLSLAVCGMHMYDRTMPASVLIYFLTEHLARYEDDITKFMQEHDCKGFVDYKADDAKRNLSVRVTSSNGQWLVPYSDERVREDKEYTTIQPRFIVTVTANGDNKYDCDPIVCIDEDTTSPYLIDHLHDLFSWDVELPEGTVEGVYLLRVTSIDERSYCHDFGIYEYDSYLDILESTFLAHL